MTDAIEHITITTGATRMSPRSEVAPTIIARLRHAIRIRTPLYGWTIVREASAEGTHVYRLEHGGAAVARCWLCTSAAASDATWEAAAAHVADERVVLHRPRGTPWLAAALLPGALQVSPDVLMQAGDLERCVAWALLES